MSLVGTKLNETLFRRFIDGLMTAWADTYLYFVVEFVSVLFRPALSHRRRLQSRSSLLILFSIDGFFNSTRTLFVAFSSRFHWQFLSFSLLTVDLTGKTDFRELFFVPSARHFVAIIWSNVNISELSPRIPENSSFRQDKEFCACLQKVSIKREDTVIEDSERKVVSRMFTVTVLLSWDML